MKRIPAGGNLLFRDAIKNAIGACDVTLEHIGKRCEVTRQTVSLMLRGGCRIRRGTARAIAETMIGELRAEIRESRERINLLEHLIADVKSTYDRDYVEEGKPNELSDL